MSRFLNNTNLDNLSTQKNSEKEESINNSSRLDNFTVSTQSVKKTFLNSGSGYGYGVNQINFEGNKINNIDFNLDNLSTQKNSEKEESINNSSRLDNFTVSTQSVKKTFLNSGSGYGYGVNHTNFNLENNYKNSKP